MDSLRTIVARTVPATAPDNTFVVNLLIALFVLVFLSLLAFALLALLRRHRIKKMGTSPLPRYTDELKRGVNHRRLTIQTGNGRSSTIVFNKDGQPMLANPQQPPHSPANVPQIHITFPDEHDDQGRAQSGRAFVVRVGDTTVGLEPIHDEQLPAYEKESKSQFYALDIDKIGGLKEKEYR
ncbi:hypothetical protein B0T18DRAFT_423867 [Schizothecium vesticola]|uniref:Uncharacterized protein n=1 Tax=Schizothecium vesticola TaxID=314040 RepID=A0AA40F8P2_9PEZI|nr:hypothetical protein B0T18DRAFT_423867 [Schizothecium vesticola]